MVYSGSNEDLSVRELAFGNPIVFGHILVLIEYLSKFEVLLEFCAVLIGLEV